MASSSSSSVVGKKNNATQHQVFINFRGKELRKSFIGFLVRAMREANINVFIDEKQQTGEYLKDLILVEIKKSRVALAIISKEYTTSKWCLEELVKIMELVGQGSLTVIPIFYKLEIPVVAELKGTFGDNFRQLQRENQHEPAKTQKWKEALTSISDINGMSLPEQSDMTDVKFIDSIIEVVKELLAKIPSRELVSDEGIFFVHAREFKISHVDKPEHWKWSSIYDHQSGTYVEVAELISVYWLEIKGEFRTRQLIPGKKYEVVFMVYFDDKASGWENPVTLKLKLDHPDVSPPLQEQPLCLDKYICNDRVDIQVGVFEGPPENTAAQIYFILEENVTKKLKVGLMVRGVAIRPVEQVEM